MSAGQWGGDRAANRASELSVVVKTESYFAGRKATRDLNFSAAVMAGTANSMKVGNQQDTR